MNIEWLDRLLVAHWAGAVAGDRDSIDIVLRIIQSRCKMLGLT